jgi:hypothetical protein
MQWKYGSTLYTYAMCLYPCPEPAGRVHTLSKWLTDTAIYRARTTVADVWTSELEQDSTIERTVLCIKRSIGLTLTLVTKRK